MGLHVAEGKIDSGYRGEIHCFVTAQGSPVEVNRGDRLAQLVIVKIELPDWVCVEKLPESERGELGLGSTGKE
jgi:dUTP pyrophosphatase